jgi:hypothetical protein
VKWVKWKVKSESQGKENADQWKGRSQGKKSEFAFKGTCFAFSGLPFSGTFTFHFTLSTFDFLFRMARNFLNPSDSVRFCKADFSRTHAIGGKERQARFGTGAII